MLCSRCGHSVARCACAPAPAASGDSSAPELLDAPLWPGESELQEEVRKRLVRYRERRRLRGGVEQQRLEFPRPARRQSANNLIVFQKTPVLESEPLAEAVPQRMLDPCTTLFPAPAPVPTSSSAVVSTHSPVFAPLSTPASAPAGASASVPLPAAPRPATTEPQSMPAETAIAESAGAESFGEAPVAALPETAPATEVRESPFGENPDYAAAGDEGPLGEGFLMVEPRRLPALYPPAFEIAVNALPAAPALARILQRPPAAAALRLRAALLDAAATAALAGIFAASAWVAARLERQHAIVSGWLPLLLLPGVWAALYLLFSYHLCGATPGMRRLGLRLAGFDGQPCSRAQLRLRAWASLLSLAALGMGFFWAWVDDDGLSWHDHLSESYVVQGRA